MKTNLIKFYSLSTLIAVSFLTACGDKPRVSKNLKNSIHRVYTTPQEMDGKISFEIALTLSDAPDRTLFLETESIELKGLKQQETYPAGLKVNSKILNITGFFPNPDAHESYSKISGILFCQNLKECQEFKLELVTTSEPQEVPEFVSETTTLTQKPWIQSSRTINEKRMIESQNWNDDFSSGDEKIQKTKLLIESTFKLEKAAADLTPRSQEFPINLYRHTHRTTLELTEITDGPRLISFSNYVHYDKPISNGRFYSFDKAGYSFHGKLDEAETVVSVKREIQQFVERWAKTFRFLKLLEGDLDFFESDTARAETRGTMNLEITPKDSEPQESQNFCLNADFSNQGFGSLNHCTEIPLKTL
jgi:hypothetical protein